MHRSHPFLEIFPRKNIMRNHTEDKIGKNCHGYTTIHLFVLVHLRVLEKMFFDFLVMYMYMYLQLESV